MAVGVCGHKPTRRDIILVEHMLGGGRARDAPRGAVPAGNELAFRDRRAGVEYVLVKPIDLIFLIALPQAGCAGKLEVADVVGKKVSAHICEAGAIFREFTSVVIAAVTNDTGSRHKFFATAVEIDRGE